VESPSPAGGGGVGFGALGTGLAYDVHTSVDRYAVVEPGIPTVVRKVYGGGMPIGSSAPAKGGGGKGDKKGGGAGSGPATPHFPNTLTLKQLAVPTDAEEATPQPATLLKGAPLPQEPLAVWGGGPVLAIALASDTGTATSNLYVALATANLQFFGWEIVTPPQVPGEGAAGSGAGAGSAYAAAAAGLQSITAKAKEQATRPRLPLVSAASATPAPSVPGVVNGSGVCWDADGTRVAVLSAAFAHVLAVVSSPADALARAPGGSGALPGYSGSYRTAVELCRVPLSALSAGWHAGMLCAVEASGQRLLALLPPVADLTSSAAAAASLTRGATRSQPALMELASLLPPPCLDPSLLMTPLPLAKRAPGCLSLAAPLLSARGHLVLSHWLGPRGWPPGSTLGSGAGDAALGTGLAVSAVPLVHPGLKAVLAAAGPAALAVKASLAGGLPVLPQAAPSAAHPARAMQAYLAGGAAAASWGALLPPEAQSGLAHYLAGLGHIPGALALPCIPPAIGIGLALRTRMDAFVARAGASSAGTKSGPAGAQSLLPLADALVATNYLTSLVRDGLADEELLMLCSPALHSSALRFAVGAAEAASGAVGVWPQVAAFLSLAAVVYPHVAEAARSAIIVLAARLRDLGQAGEAMLVGSVLPQVASRTRSGLGRPAGDSARTGADDDADEGDALTSVDLVVAALRAAGSMAIGDGLLAAEAAAFGTAASL
jgi:hypothetical protein